jgi:hypothetical protein
MRSPLIRKTNMLERLFREVKRRTVVGVFPNEMSASTLAKEIALRSTEQGALKRYLTMDALEAMEKPKPQLSRPRRRSPTPTGFHTPGTPRDPFLRMRRTIC